MGINSNNSFYEGSNPTPTAVANLDALVNEATAASNAAIAANTTAQTAASTATTEAGIATTQATNASASATSASGSASTATTQATNASTSATAASGSASAAATSATNASGSASSALTNWQSFETAYYGALAADPTLNPIGGAIRNGDMYYSTSLNTLRVRVSGAWQTNPSTAGFAHSGANSDITSLTAVTSATLGAATVTSMNGGQLAGHRNRIINGTFGINQRGYVSGTALAAAAYGHDRWKAGASGGTYTFTAGVPDTTITITANTLTQVIESVNIEGGTYTLSWTGTAQARVYQGAPTGAYAASPVTVAGLTAGTNTIVEFNAGTLGKIQFEFGSTATPFERRLYGAEMLMCYRYYQRYTSASATAFQVNGYQTAGNAVLNVISYPPMRASPTATVIGTWTFANTSALNLAPLNSTNTVLAYIIPTATGTASAVSPANGGFDLSAEL